MNWDEIKQIVKEYKLKKFNELINHLNFGINSFYKIDKLTTFCISKNIINEWLIEYIQFDDYEGRFNIVLKNQCYQYIESDINNITKINKYVKNFKNRSIDLDEIRSKIE